MLPKFQSKQITELNLDPCGQNPTKHPNTPEKSMPTIPREPRCPLLPSLQYPSIQPLIGASRRPFPHRPDPRDAQVPPQEVGRANTLEDFVPQDQAPFQHSWQMLHLEQWDAIHMRSPVGLDPGGRSHPLRRSPSQPPTNTSYRSVKPNSFSCFSSTHRL